MVIEGKKKPTVKAFWIYARTVGFCQNRGGSEQKAVLMYKSPRTPSTRTPPTRAPGITLGRQLPTGTVSSLQRIAARRWAELDWRMANPRRRW